MKEIDSLDQRIVFSEGQITTLFRNFNWKEYDMHFLLVDSHTRKLCFPLLKKHLPQKAIIIQINQGEQNKNLKTCELIWNTLEKNQAGRNSLLINLGGGQLCDIGGFSASVYKRGIHFINIPTTLIAQADSCIGGKTGINFLDLKNHIGTFCHPEKVFVHTPFLKTLPQRELNSGMAEIVKHALIKNKILWNFITQNSFSLHDFPEELVQESISIKSKIVATDFKEKGERKLLNFGHTIGHAIETLMLTRKKQILHGEAVAAGMIAESYLSFRVNALPQTELNEILAVLKNNFILPKIKTSDFSTLLKLMSDDKKNKKRKINFSLLSEIGKASIDHTPSNTEILKSLHFYASIND